MCMSKQVWIAKDKQGRFLALTEKEAHIHFKNNNVANRMQLEFIGVSDGKKYKEAQMRLHEENKEKLNYPNPSGQAPEPPHVLNLKEEIEQQALAEEAKVAEANGMTTPNSSDVMVSGKGVSPDVMQKATNALTRNLGR